MQLIPKTEEEWREYIMSQPAEVSLSLIEEDKAGEIRCIKCGGIPEPVGRNSDFLGGPRVFFLSLAMLGIWCDRCALERMPTLTPTFIADLRAINCDMKAVDIGADEHNSLQEQS